MEDGNNSSDDKIIITNIFLIDIIKFFIVASILIGGYIYFNVLILQIPPPYNSLVLIIINCIFLVPVAIAIPEFLKEFNRFRKNRIIMSSEFLKMTIHPDIDLKLPWDVIKQIKMKSKIIHTTSSSFEDDRSMPHTKKASPILEIETDKKIYTLDMWANFYKRALKTIEESLLQISNKMGVKVLSAEKWFSYTFGRGGPYKTVKQHKIDSD